MEKGQVPQQPDANLIATADAIDALLPQLRAQLPPDIELDMAIDRTGSVRSSVFEVELTLVIAVLLAGIGLLVQATGTGWIEKIDKVWELS